MSEKHLCPALKYRFYIKRILNSRLREYTESFNEVKALDWEERKLDINVGFNDLFFYIQKFSLKFYKHFLFL